MVARKNEVRRLNSLRCESDSIRLVNIAQLLCCRCLRVEEAERLGNQALRLFPINAKNRALPNGRATARAQARGVCTLPRNSFTIAPPCYQFLRRTINGHTTTSQRRTESI